MLPVPDLAGLDLHDVTLTGFYLDWDAGTCSAQLRGRVLGTVSVPAQLVWRGVTEARIQRAAPWGPSSSILEGKGRSGEPYEITMQSGGTILVVAEECYVEIDSAAA
jgi:hypothetical protein